MKITLAEFDAFSKSLSDDWYFEGDDCFIDDEFWDGKFNPKEVIDVKRDEITLCYQGRESLSEGDKYKDFLAEFKKWKTGIDFDIVVIMIPKDKKAELVAMVKATFGVDVK